ncbi:MULTISPECIES: AAA family ATPase [Streptomyces]|uniref:Predicted ATP-binding protein involved in virulence n=1 Tax=Streptomyces melanosporofaciens TaxID=67327 RepID=A0A1H4V7Y7_STRMJ|nr:AAA family ATPase [Streptomyces melanosporofaciens]SEC76990.1 Predicted ATP-binding protein involved in virulence [Streptomyces melanosporofaciens]
MYVTDLELSGVRGFHGHRAARLRFPRREDGSYAGWTVLAGRNGSGKSTVLQALALVLQGPAVTHALLKDAGDWMTRGARKAVVEASVVGPDHVDARWVSVDDLPHEVFPETGSVRMVWERMTKRGESHVRLRRPSTTSAFELQRRAESGPWQETPQGWLCLGYGPYRRLDGGRSLRSAAGFERVDRLATLFDENVCLAEGVTWLIEQHLRGLEGRPGAQQLVEAVKLLLADGLLPDDHEVTGVDSDGLWVATPRGVLALRGMSDGYRSVTALVVDLVRHLHGAYGELRIEERGGHPVIPMPGVVLIDEVDAHLHVSWQKRIGQWMKQHFPEIQFIVTTHSPYVCQSAEPGGLIRLAAPTEARPPEVVDDELYQRVVYGSGDDAILSDLFGVDSPYSERADELRRRLAAMEFRVLDGQATEAELVEYRRLSAQLNSSLSARVSEVAAHLGREE